MGPRLCVTAVMPVCNEEETLAPIVERVLASRWLAELVIVDDGSSDAYREVLERLSSLLRVRVVFQPKNQGKGAELRRGIAESTAEIALIEDADLEYNPDYDGRLVEPIQAGLVDVVYGSRFSGGVHRVLFFWHALGNKALTTPSNVFTNLNLTDMETCYKAFRREVIQSVDPDENRFGFEPEVTAKIAVRRWRINEVPTSVGETACRPFPASSNTASGMVRTGSADVSFGQYYPSRRRA